MASVPGRRRGRDRTGGRAASGIAGVASAGRREDEREWAGRVWVVAGGGVGAVGGGRGGCRESGVRGVGAFGRVRGRACGAGYLAFGGLE